MEPAVYFERLPSIPQVCGQENHLAESCVWIGDSQWTTCCQGYATGSCVGLIRINGLGGRCIITTCKDTLLATRLPINMLQQLQLDDI